MPIWPGPAPISSPGDPAPPKPGHAGGLRLVAPPTGPRSGGWLFLLRAAGAAFALPRLGLSAAVIVLVGLLDRTWQAALGGPAPGPVAAWLFGVWESLGRAGVYLLNFRVGGASAALVEAWTRVPVEVATTPDGRIAPAGLAGLLVIGTAAGAALGVLGGAVARSAAVRLGPGREEPWTASAGFALARWRTLASVVIGPPAVVAGAVGLLRVAGAGFAVPGVDVLTALLMPLWLLLALAATALAAACTLAGPILLAAVACDDADPFEAVQRLITYAIQRPLRLIGGVLVVLVHAALALALLQLILLVVARLLAQVAGMPLDGLAATDAGPTARAAAWLAGLWGAGLIVLSGAYGVSLWITGGVAVYLWLRRAVDGQDWGDVWAAPPPEAADARATEPVPGASVTEQAVRMAGALAETGRLRLVRVGADGRVTRLPPRETNLPAVLEGLEPGAAVLDGSGVRIERTASSLCWHGAVDDAALRAALAREPGPVG